MEYPIGQWGGVEVLVKELISGLTVHCEVFVSSDDSEASWKASGYKDLVSGHFSWNPGDSYSGQAEKLSRWAVENRMDLIHFHLGGTYAFRTRSLRESPIPIVAGTGIPTVATNHGAFSLLDFCAPSRSLAPRLVMLPLFWLGRFKTLCSLKTEVTVSDNDLHNMQRWFFPLKNRFRRIYHSQLEGTEQFNENREPFILCLGTVGHRKGQSYLVEAFAKIAREFPDWRLVIAGRQDAGGEEMQKIQKSLSTSGLQSRIDLPGAVSHEEAKSLLLRCGIFAMPSLAEGLGLSLQEALFAGCPAVCSRVGGIQDMVIDGQTGLLAEVANPDSFARALRTAMNSKHDRATWGSAARERIQALGMNKTQMIKEHLALYADVLSERRKT